MLDNQQTRRLVQVLLVSALALFAELLLIRWLDVQVRALAMAKNLPLIASFLGLGIGFATADRKGADITRHAALLFAVGLLPGVLSDPPSRTVRWHGPASPQSNLGILVASSTLEVAVFFLAIVSAFAAAALAMIPLGQLTARAMRGLPALPAYAANLAGSLLGVLGSFLLAALSGPPWWGAVLVLAALLALAAEARPRVVGAALGLVVVTGMVVLDRWPGRMRVWSPYNRLDVWPGLAAPGDTTPQRGWVVQAQGIYYQVMVDFDRTPDTFYSDPYRHRRPRRVLILGAGSGNDVTAALRAGAEHIDAVEIDPQILGFGRRLHPQRPWDDPRVHPIVDDARAVLKREGARYDFIVFGVLDANLGYYSSFASSIRLDNYVYTVECFRETLRRLTPDGEVWMTVYVERPWVAARLAQMVAAAWGQPPRVKLAPESVTLVFGPGVAGGAPASERAGLDPHPGPNATDDWPFLYLRDRVLPPTVLGTALIVLGISVLLVRLLFRGALRFDRELFFLGAGFLLVETRTVAQLALLFGTTWRVSAAAIAAILLVALLSTLLASRLPLPRGAVYVLLALSLLLAWVFPPSAFLGRGTAALAAAALLLALPVFFSSILFARAIGRQVELPPALACNLIGSVAGGVLENGSLVLGISALGLVALALYAASFRARTAS